MAKYHFQKDHRLVNEQGYGKSGYIISKELGAGSFGVTYLAHSERLGVDVAVKELVLSSTLRRDSDGSVIFRNKKEQNDHEKNLQRFENEAKALMELRHANVVKIYDFFRANGTAYIVMEYCEGQTLAKRFIPVELEEEYQHLHKSRSKTRVKLDESEDADFKSRMLNEADTRELIGWLLKGLQQTHSKAICHRDIKPSNIMFRSDGMPILIDFGAARYLISRHKRESVTYVLTPGYAPIEQYSEKRDLLGPWTDIYALAAVAYKCLTGNKPPDSVARSMRDEIEILGERPFASYFLKSIDWALSVEAGKRPQSVHEWHAAWDWPIELIKEKQQESIVVAAEDPKQNWHEFGVKSPDRTVVKAKRKM